MNEQGPFGRPREPAGGRDRTARLILIGMGVVGVLLLVLVLPPVSFLRDEGPGQEATVPQARNAAAKAPKVPQGFEALSRLLKPDKDRVKGTNPPYDLTVPLLEPLSDGRNLALYTNKDGKWTRLAAAELVSGGTAAKGRVEAIPDNVAVLRRTTAAVSISGWLPAGAQPDPGALDIAATINPLDFTPAADGAVLGSASQLPAGKANIIPTVRAKEQRDVEAVNTILASPALREAHITALVQLALQPGMAGVDIDYPRLNSQRKADLTAFVTLLADKLHQADRSLSLTLPSPVRTGVSWDTGAYDWEELTRRADMVKLVPEPDPSIYHKRMEETLAFFKGKVDLKKVVLVVSRQSYEKGTDGLRALSLREALTLASAIEVRTTAQIAPNSSVVIVGKNIFQDDGASGLRWDEAAFAVAFSYPGRGGQRTVWLENSLSLAFKLDLARRFGLGGVAIEDISLDPQAPAVWDTLRAYAETGTVSLVQPNGVLLRPSWQVQAGATEVGSKGNVVWKAPAQPGLYDVSLIVSDGVIRAMQKVVLEVRAPAGGSPAATPRPAASPTARP